MKLNIEKFKTKKPRDLRINRHDIDDFERLLEVHGGFTVAERKYDGHGILIDTRDSLHLYSLQKNQWNPDCLPELANDLNTLPKGFYIGELVGKPTKEIFSNTDEFSAVLSRNLSTVSEKTRSLATEQPLEVRLYDILTFNGDVIADQPNTLIREILEDLPHYEHILPTERTEIRTAAALQQYFHQQLANNTEGLVVKNPHSSYTQPGDFVKGKRTSDWVKLKRSTTFDLAVLGMYQTEARERQGWPCSNVLLGTYNKQTELFETITKLTLPSKQLAEEIHAAVAPYCQSTWGGAWPELVNSTPHSIEVKYSPQLQWGKLLSKIPGHYVTFPQEHALILEVSAMEVTSPKKTWHSCGIENGQVHSLRHATYVRTREKTPLEATSTQQIQQYNAGMAGG